jgi:hypothetical protein
MTSPEQQSKQLLREAFAGALPQEIVRRPKQKFSSGAGSATTMARRAEQVVSDADFARERERLQHEWGYALESKQALVYYRIVHESSRTSGSCPASGRAAASNVSPSARRVIRPHPELMV